MITQYCRVVIVFIENSTLENCSTYTHCTHYVHRTLCTHNILHSSCEHNHMMLRVVTIINSLAHDDPILPVCDVRTSTTLLPYSAKF